MKSTDYNNIENEFEKKSNKIFKNNVYNYSKNDKEFLRHINQLFGNAMSAKGLNVLDPLYANFFHYNKMSMRGNLDAPKMTRTYIFFTRPELNFSYENINAVPFFKWLYSKRIGKMIMASLTDPEYFINAPSALNGVSGKMTNEQIYQIMREYTSTVSKMHKAYNTSRNDSDWNTIMGGDDNSDNRSPTASFEEVLKQKYGYGGAGSSGSSGTQSTNEKDDPEEVARLNSLEIDSLYDSELLEKFKKEIEDGGSKFNTEYERYEKNLNSILSKLETIDKPLSEDEKYKYYTSMNLHQAKHILKENHNREGDKFEFTSPFIPLLNNTCTQCNGGKDLALESHNYEEDEFGSYQHVATGMDEIFGPGTLNTIFEDGPFSPVSLLFMCWIFYIHYVSRGFITTSREHETERILDYTCSIYAFVIGEDGRRIERFGKYTGCYPTSFPLSSQIDHNLALDQEAFHKINISWKYNRYEPMDPQVLMDFNFLSESEWLCKLKPPLWENLYDRHGNVQALNNSFEKIERGGLKDGEIEDLRKIGRSSSLWELINDTTAGMSGQLPPALIEADYPDSPILQINNYWGGYPFIKDGAELIWVMPKYAKTSLNVVTPK